MARFRRGARKNPSPSSGSLLGMTERMWRRNRIRLEDGIFFADDTWIPLTLDDEGTIAVGERAALEEILETNPDGWAEVSPVHGCEARSGELRATGGGGDSEGEGFIAVTDGNSQRLLWLLHLSCSERFRTLDVSDSILRALSEEHLRKLEWAIPLGKPEKIEILSRTQG